MHGRLRTKLKKERKWSSLKNLNRWLDYSMKKTVTDSQLAWLNSCQGKGSGFSFRLNYSIHQHTGSDCDTGS